MNETCRTSTETSGRLWNVCGRASRVRGKSESFSWIKGWCYSSLVSQIVSSGEKMIRCRITETRRKRWRATNRRQNSGCLHQSEDSGHRVAGVPERLQALLPMYHLHSALQGLVITLGLLGHGRVFFAGLWGWRRRIVGHGDPRGWRMDIAQLYSLGQIHAQLNIDHSMTHF
jgi:hypothetical protein